MHFQCCSYFALNRYVLLFPLHTLHSSLLITFTSCYLLCTASLPLCMLQVPSWAAPGQPISQDEGPFPQWWLHLTLYLQWKERMTNPAVLHSSSYNTLKSWVYSNHITALAIRERNKPESTPIWEEKGVFDSMSALVQLGIAQHLPCRADFALLNFSIIPPSLQMQSCVSWGGNRIFSIMQVPCWKMAIAPGQSCCFVPVGAFKQKSLQVTQTGANFCLMLAGWDSAAVSFPHFVPLCERQEISKASPTKTGMLIGSWHYKLKAGPGGNLSSLNVTGAEGL